MERAHAEMPRHIRGMPAGPLSTQAITDFGLRQIAKRYLAGHNSARVASIPPVLDRHFAAGAKGGTHTLIDRSSFPHAAQRERARATFPLAHRKFVVLGLRHLLRAPSWTPLTPVLRPLAWLFAEVLVVAAVVSTSKFRMAQACLS